MYDDILLAADVKSGRIFGIGSQILQIFVLAALLPSGNRLKHFPHTLDVLNSSTNNTSQSPRFFNEIASFLVPGQRLYFLMGELELRFAAPMKNNADLSFTIRVVILSIALVDIIYWSNASRAYFRRVYVRIPSLKNFNRCSMY